jgi:acyl carrier protein
VEPRLRSLVADALGVEQDVLGEDTSLVHDLAADSLDLLDVAVRAEDEFQITFPDRDIGAVSTFGDLLAATLALVACRMRLDEAAAVSTGRVELRIGSGEVPRFVRAGTRSPYDGELLRDDLKAAHMAEAVDLIGLGAAPAGAFERTLARAGFAGADVRTPDRPLRHAAPEDEDLRGWPTRRLVAHAVALVEDLRKERETSLDRLAEDPGSMSDLVARRCTTDEHATAFRRIVETYIDVLDDSRPILYAAARELGRLDGVRRAVDARALDARETRAAFDSIADALLCYVHALEAHVGWARTRLPPRAMAPRVRSAADREDLRA